MMSDPALIHKDPKDYWLSSRMAVVRPSPTAAVSDEARRLRADGRVIINLGEGELDFDTPSHIQDAGISAIRNGSTKYTAVAGTEALKEAVARKFERENGITYGPDEIVVSAGAKQAIFNAFLATLDDGDEVIVPAPYWVSYPDMVTLAGGTSIIADCGLETDFKLTPQALEAHITNRTKWVIINSPSNPTGALYSEDELTGLAAVLRRYPKAMVMSDDIYEQIVFDGAFATMASVAPDVKDRVLTVNGVSKCFSMTGWRVGYAGGPSWLISALTTLQSQSTSNASSISQEAAVAALDGSLSFLDDWQDRLLARRNVVLKTIDETDGVLSADPPAAAFYVFASCAGAIGLITNDGEIIQNDLDMAAYLLKAAGVATIAGTAFGKSGYLRISYAVDDADLENACASIVAACKRLS